MCGVYVCGVCVVCAWCVLHSVLTWPNEVCVQLSSVRAVCVWCVCGNCVAYMCDSLSHLDKQCGVFVLCAWCV